MTGVNFYDYATLSMLGSHHYVNICISDALHTSFSFAFEPVELEPDKWGAMMLWTDLQILYHQHW